MFHLLFINRHGQGKVEPTPYSFGRVQTNLSAHHFNQLDTDCKAEAGPPELSGCRIIFLGKRFKNARLALLVDPDARIGDFKQQLGNIVFLLQAFNTN